MTLMILVVTLFPLLVEKRRVILVVMTTKFWYILLQSFILLQKFVVLLAEIAVVVEEIRLHFHIILQVSDLEIKLLDLMMESLRDQGRSGSIAFKMIRCIA